MHTWWFGSPSRRRGPSRGTPVDVSFSILMLPVAVARSNEGDELRPSATRVLVFAGASHGVRHAETDRRSDPHFVGRRVRIGSGMVMTDETCFEHTLRNYIAIILGHAELLQKEMPANDPRLEDLREIYKAATAAAALVNTPRSPRRDRT